MPGPIEVESVKQWNESLRSATAAGKTVVVDFHATWCGPCKQIAPVYDSLAKQNDHVTFLRVDVDKLQPISAKVSAMPTFLAIKAGQVVDTLKGADPPSLTRLVLTHKGPSPPLPPLPPAAESAKLAANAHFNAGRFADAGDGYSEAPALAPDSFALLGNRSLAYAKADPPRWEEALADAEAAVGVEGGWGKGWVRVGEALEGLGRREEAVKAYEKAAANSEGAIQKDAKQKLAAVKSKLGWH